MYTYADSENILHNEYETGLTSIKIEISFYFHPNVSCSTKIQRDYENTIIDKKKRVIRRRHFFHSIHPNPVQRCENFLRIINYTIFLQNNRKIQNFIQIIYKSVWGLMVLLRFSDNFGLEFFSLFSEKILQKWK